MAMFFNSLFLFIKEAFAERMYCSGLNEETFHPQANKIIDISKNCIIVNSFYALFAFVTNPLFNKNVCN